MRFFTGCFLAAVGALILWVVLFMVGVLLWELVSG